MDYLNMPICFSTGSPLFRFTVLALALFSLVCGFRIRSQPHKSNKTKKRAEKKKRVENKADIPANMVSVKNDSQLEKHSNDLKVECARVFSYQSVLDATEDFRLDWRMSADRLGGTFIGQIVDTKELVIIRRLKAYTNASVEEFVDQVLLLSQTNHPNLAKLIGYSFQHWRRFLVYKPEPRGSLETHLHGDQVSLDWERRMEIALGVSKGLEYLQNMKPPILHLYIKTANIWLDNDFTPKISAFGVVQMFPSLNRVDCSYETIGSYLHGLHDSRLTKEVTPQTDIYGFGIFLLEMITGRKGIYFEDGARHFLSDWVQPYLKDEENQCAMVDPKLQGVFNKEKLKEACKIAAACIKEQPSSRPLIGDLVTRMIRLAERDYDAY